MTLTRVPMAERLERVPTHLIEIQLFRLPPSLRSSVGGPSRLLTRMSTSPSLSKSPKAQPRPRLAARDRRPGFRGHVLEAPVAQVPVEELRLPIGDVQLSTGQLRVDVAVGDEDIRPAVVVEVEEIDAEAEVLAVDAEPRLDARVDEAGAVVAVQRGHLFGEVGPDDVEPAVGIVVADPDAHPGERHAVLVERRSGGNRDLAEGPVVIVAIQQARSAVAGHVDVRPSVVVEIGRRRPHPVGAGRPPVATRRTPSRTARADGQSPMLPRHRRMSRRRGSDRGRWCRRRSRADRTGRGSSL